MAQAFSWLAQFSPKMRQKFAYSKLWLGKTEINKGPVFFIYLNFYSTWLVLRLPIFKSIGTLVDEIWGPPPPPPQWTQVLKFHGMGLGLNFTNVIQ